MNSKEKAFWLMPGGAMQEPAARYIKSLGLKLIISDGSDNCHLRSLADYFYKVDIFDVQKNLELFNDLKQRFNIVGIFTLAADCHNTIASINEGNKFFLWDRKTSELCSDKSKTRLFLKDFVSQPEFVTISEYEEISSLRGKFNDKCVVLKVPDSSGSRGFRKFQNIDLITIEDFNSSMQFSKLKFLIIESYIYPTEQFISEVSVEGIWNWSNFKIINIVDRIFPRDIHHFGNILDEYKNLNDGIEIGHVSQSLLPNKIIKSIEVLMNQVGKKLNLNNKPLSTLKLDIMLDQDSNPVIIEMTPRCSGGWDSSFSNIILGGDIQKSILNYLIGKYSAEETFNNINKDINYNRKCFVLGHSNSESENCIGREFYYSFSGDNINKLIVDSLNKRDKGDTIVPIHY